jgi:hypothetical protein
VQNEKSKKERIEQSIFDAVDNCRAGVLATFELHLGDEPDWKSIRAMLLRSFGDRGLSGRISEVLNNEFAAIGGVR